MSLHPPLSSSADSHSTLFRTSSDSSSHTVPPSATTNLYVTFKVLQLLNTFRKRVKTRVQSSRILRKETSTRLTEDFCQDFERTAFEEIDRYLGRKTSRHTRKRTYPKDGYSLHSETDRKSIAPKRTTVATAEERQQIPSKRVQWLLDELNQSVKSGSKSLIAVAKNHELFVARNSEFRIEQLSLKQLTQLLVVVKDLLTTLRKAAPSRSHIKTFTEGNAILDLTVDETKAANLEHLLLCLKDQLLRLLVSKLVHFVRKQLVECQRDKTRHCEEWFFEFPDARHPLSTTWPWSIRPSLAVIWGVCWMFYDSSENTWNPDNEELLPPGVAEGILSISQMGMMLQQRPHSAQQLHYYDPAANLGQAISPPHRPLVDPRHPRSLQHSHSPTGQVIMTQPLQQQHRGLTVASSSPHPHPLYSSAPDQAAAHASAGLAGTNIQYTAAPPASYAASAQPALSAPNWTSLPEENFNLHYSPFQASTHGADDVGQWNQLAPHAEQQQHFNVNNWHSYPPPNLPPRSRNSVTPDIRVITDPIAYPELQRQPQDIYQSATSISTVSSHPLQEFPQTYSTSHLSPQIARTFMTSDEKMQNTPPHSPHSPRMMAVMGEQLSRKRSHDDMTGSNTLIDQNGAPSGHGHSRSPSVHSQTQNQNLSPNEATSPRTRTIKRGDPPTDAQNKFICDYSEECTGMTFDRKCEWSKHMDKHDRPYRCQHAECAKLQGFTYSGGLLRHEREVHNKHGGPKAALVCPHTECKRHSGKGFTRKENLNEHIRRVHGENKPSQSQSQSIRQDAVDALNTAEEMEGPYFTNPINPEDADSPMHKRRRYTQGMSERSASVDVEDLRHEVDRLRQDNEEKDSRLMQMQEQLDELHKTMQLMQENQQTQAPGPV